MKFFFLYCLLAFVLYASCPAKPGETAGLSMNTDTIHFKTTIQPILQNKCSPCHFPGGKMYVRMPFDQDTTIINHQAGILKRIKGEEGELLRRFLQQKAN